MNSWDLGNTVSCSAYHRWRIVKTSMGVGRENRCQRDEGPHCQPTRSDVGGGGGELEAGFSRLLKMTANIDVKFTVPDDVNVKSSLKI